MTWDPASSTRPSGGRRRSLLSEIAERYAEASRRWLADAPNWPHEWVDVSDMSSWLLKLNPQQVKAMHDELVTVIGRYEGMTPAEGAEEVQTILQVLPRSRGADPMNTSASPLARAALPCSHCSPRTPSRCRGTWRRSWRSPGSCSRRPVSASIQPRRGRRPRSGRRIRFRRRRTRGPVGVPASERRGRRDELRRRGGDPAPPCHDRFGVLAAGRAGVRGWAARRPPGSRRGRPCSRTSPPTPDGASNA